MRINATTVTDFRPALRAFSILEVLIGMAIMVIAVVSLYAGISSCVSVTKAAREDLRATQIMLERMEGIRLYNWDQLVYSNNMIPPTFLTSYYPVASSGQSTGITYYGTMVITNAVLSPSASYAANMRAITVTVFWTNYYGANMADKVVRSRTMTTYTARDGIQNYVYNN
jgi:Tfp pilus assembly protein PilV